ncbi:extracellular solute-binding protein [Desulfoluna butyratoxydans]|uniref:Solute-binding protein family 5 domain n=1 Tax=Desulfoluna butyratoxydans TaxID=231438 RepID=A0A4U8YGF9_9BACT|nr:extracellular solute-binding protein [Desulfoluna butyratoxydans]VFQ42436.1 solute-binding protein family 5 domain [Desulfoluna butyratoxydans]
MRQQVMARFIVLTLAFLVWGGTCVAGETLPEGITWLTNHEDPVFASPHAVKGGVFRSAIASYPLTFRTVGPDSNGSFRSNIGANQMSLVALHPNTERIIPALATHWAFGDDKKTMYFKLDPRARWSDGVPVTAGDFAYTMEFMRSKDIVAPWYNRYYTEEIEKVIVYDDHTLAVVSTRAEPDLHLKLTISPTPRHYYGKIGKDFVGRYNWKIVPNTGPYQISSFKKGKEVVFTRKKDWWAKDLHYNKGRYNVNKVIFRVVRDFNTQWEYFRKGRFDTFRITYPKYWYRKSATEVVDKGYVERIWFFNDTRRPPQGFYLNEDREIFKDRNVRLAFAYAMNVDKVINKVLRGDYFRLKQAYQGYGEYTDETIEARPYDIDKVAEYMTASGWTRGGDGIWEKEGKRFSVEVSYSFDEITERLVVLKEEAKKAGVEIRIQKLDNSAAFKKFLEKRHDVAMMAWSTSFHPRYWQTYHSDNAHKPQTNNITNTDNKELDKYIDRYHNSLDEEERKVLSRKIQRMLHDQANFVPTMMVPYFRQAYWRWWRLPEPPGTKHSSDLFDPFGDSVLWYDKARHEETKKAMKKKKAFEPVTIIDETFKPKG